MTLQPRKTSASEEVLCQRWGSQTGFEREHGEAAAAGTTERKALVKNRKENGRLETRGEAGVEDSSPSVRKGAVRLPPFRKRDSPIPDSFFFARQPLN